MINSHLIHSLFRFKLAHHYVQRRAFCQKELIEQCRKLSDKHLDQGLCCFPFVHFIVYSHKGIFSALALNLPKSKSSMLTLHILGAGVVATL